MKECKPARGLTPVGALSKRGKCKAWWYRFKYDGIECRKSTGTADRTEAEIILRQKLDAVTNTASESRMEILRDTLIGELATSIRASTIGAAGEKLVCVDLMNRGFAVFEAASPNSPCDLIAVQGGRCIRIEVKVGSVTKSGKIDHNPIRPTCSFDVLAVVTRRNGIFYSPSLDGLSCTQNGASVTKTEGQKTSEKGTECTIAQ